MGRTRKPCPGCGACPGKPFRETGQVCGRCKVRLGMYEDMERRLRCFEAEQARRKHIPETTRELFPDYLSVPHSVSRMPKELLLHLEDEELNRALQNATRSLIARLGIPVKAERNAFLRSFPGGTQEWHMCAPKGFNCAYKRWIEVVKLVVQLSYARGREDGGDLLARLARGDISVPEVDRQDAERSSGFREAIDRLAQLYPTEGRDEGGTRR